jgi:hypothetical protein
MTNVKCPACAKVWNVKNPAAPKSNTPAPETAGKKTEDSVAPAAEKDDFAGFAMVAGLVGGAMMVIAMVGIVIIILNRQPDPSQTATAEVEETIKPSTPQPYRVIDLPEETRRRIYKDYRQVAVTTVERPLILPQGTRPRESLEDMLQKTYDRELMHFAALHDITVDDVQEVIKEGDAKVWDDRPRSHAVRDGKRVYSKEMSEGWKKNPNRK